MSDLTRAELAALAERKIWRVLINADEEFCGMEPSMVRARAQGRLDYLEGLLAHRLDVTDAVLGELPDEVRDRAFGEAAIEMAATMKMIRFELEQVRR